MSQAVGPTALAARELRWRKAGPGLGKRISGDRGSDRTGDFAARARSLGRARQPLPSRPIRCKMRAISAGIASPNQAV